MGSLFLHFALVNFAAVSVVSVMRLKNLFTTSLDRINQVLFYGAAIALALVAGASPSSGWLLYPALLLCTATALIQYFYQTIFLVAFVAPIITSALAYLWLQHFASNIPIGAGIRAALVDVHIACALMGHLLALGSGIISALFLWQQKALKRRHLTALKNYIPALDLLERILLASLWVSLVFLSFALLTGGVISYWGPALSNSTVLKLVISLVVWLSYVIFLLGRVFFFLPLKKVATLNLVALFLLAGVFWGQIVR